MEEGNNTEIQEQAAPFDIFQWANLTDGIKNELDVEFFLFNKNFTPYTTSFSGELNNQIKPLFLFDIIVIFYSNYYGDRCVYSKCDW